MTIDEFIELAKEVFGGESQKQNEEIIFECSEEMIIHLRILPKSDACFIYRLVESKDVYCDSDVLADQTLTDLERLITSYPFTVGYDSTDTYRQLQWYLMPCDYDEASARNMLSLFRQYAA